MKSYVFNLETTKIELHFDKADYDALTDDQRRELSSAFLWSRTGKCWVSRAKEPNLYRPKKVAEKLGFTEEQRKGERISYEEQLERQSDRAETRAERYEEYAANATKRGQQLQKPLDSMRGDIAFFTQPEIEGHAGSQAFARRREKMFQQYGRGFEEYRKSDYFKDKAQTALKTAEARKFKDKGYLDRRIKECQKEITKREQYILDYEALLSALESGEKKLKYNGKPYTVDELTSWIEMQLELVEKAMDKQAYLENCLDELGGLLFNQSNIKPGYIVKIRHGDVEVLRTGPKNITYKILTGGAAGMTLQAAYAEIKEVVKAMEVKKQPHPFKVGEQFKATRRTYVDNSFTSTKTEVVYEIVKASDSTIQLKPINIDEKPLTRKPKKSHSGSWVFSIDDTYENTFFKGDDANT